LGLSVAENVKRQGFAMQLEVYKRLSTTA